MTNMQTLLDNISVGDVVFFAEESLLENRNDCMTSYTQYLDSGIVSEIIPEKHSVCLEQRGRPGWYAYDKDMSLHQHTHDVDEIILTVDEMTEMLWRAYAHACRRTNDLQYAAEEYNNGFFHKHFGGEDRVADYPELASVFGFDCAGLPVICFAHLSGYDENNNPIFHHNDLDFVKGTISEIEIFNAEDGQSLVSACLEMVRGYLI